MYIDKCRESERERERETTIYPLQKEDIQQSCNPLAFLLEVSLSALPKLQCELGIWPDCNLL